MSFVLSYFIKGGWYYMIKKKIKNVYRMLRYAYTKDINIKCTNVKYINKIVINQLYFLFTEEVGVKVVHLYIVELGNIFLNMDIQ